MNKVVLFTFFSFQLVHRELTMTGRGLTAQVCFKMLSFLTPFYLSGV